MYRGLKQEVEGELLVRTMYCWDGQRLAVPDAADPESLAAGLQGVAAGSLADEFGQIQQHQKLHWTAAAAVAVAAEGHQGSISASHFCHGNVAEGGVGVEGAAWAGRDQSPHLPCRNKQYFLPGSEAAHWA